MAIPQIFDNGFRLINGTDLNNALAMPMLQTNPGLTALAGGGRPNATALVYGSNQVTTVASAADSVLLPIGMPGSMVVVRNSGANAMQVFGRGSDTINGTAGSTGISVANAKTVIFFAVNEVSGVTTWVSLLGA
jgi:hypothetical protein